MIPNVVGLLAMILVSRNSDRQERRWHAAIPALVGGIACLLSGATHLVIPSMALLAFSQLVFTGQWLHSGPYLTRS
jgi:hypothetical protein